MRIDVVGKPVENSTDESIQEMLRAKDVWSLLGAGNDGMDSFTTHAPEGSPKEIIGRFLNRLKEEAQEKGLPKPSPDDLRGGYFLVSSEVDPSLAKRLSPVKKWGVHFVTGLPQIDLELLSGADSQEILAWIKEAAVIEPKDDWGLDDFFDDDDFDDGGDDSDEDVSDDSPPFIDVADSVDEVNSETDNEGAGERPSSVVSEVTEGLPFAPLGAGSESSDSEPEGTEIEDEAEPEIEESAQEEEYVPPQYREIVSEAEQEGSVSAEPRMDLRPSKLSPPAQPSPDNSIIVDDSPEVHPKEDGGPNGDSDPRLDERVEQNIEGGPSSIIVDSGDHRFDKSSPSEVAAAVNAQAERELPVITKSTEGSDSIRVGSGRNERRFDVSKSHRRSSKVFFVTGGHGGAGKSTVSYSLAEAASIGLRNSRIPVFLIETDINNAKLAQNLNVENYKNVYEISKQVASMVRDGRSVTDQSIFDKVIEHSHRVPDADHPNREFYVLPAPYDVSDIVNPEEVKQGIKVVLRALESVKCHIYLDATEISGDAFDPFTAYLSGSPSDHAVVVGGGSRAEEIRRACEIIEGNDRRPEDRKPNRNIHVILNKTHPRLHRDVGSRLSPFAIRAMLPEIDYLSDDSILEATGGKGTSWIGNPMLPKEVVTQRRVFAIKALSNMGIFNVQGDMSAIQSAPVRKESPKGLKWRFGRKKSK